MKILIIHAAEVFSYPPVINLVKNLLANGHELTLVTYDVRGLDDKSLESIQTVLLNPRNKGNLIRRLLNYPMRKKELKEALKKFGKKSNVVWTTTDITVRDLGKELLNYKHVMQLMELVEDIPLIPYQKVLKTNLKLYAQRAYKVVVPEINRAYIQKTWWKLKNTPVVLPNKPYTLTLGNLNEKEKETLSLIKNETRKIILYQGVFAPDRDLDIFAKAIEILGEDKYCLYIMGKDNELREALSAKYKNVKYLGFIPAPNHLYFTKYAYIGLLPYQPSTECWHYSILNAMFCAPNKIYEYSAYGIPMIGTDVAGLAEPFANYNMGICCKKITPESVSEAVHQIEDRYLEMKENAYKFYKDIDLDGIVNEILYH